MGQQGRRGRPIARERRHTLYFLAETRAVAAVFLDTEVDMSAVLAHRDRQRAAGRRYSIVTYVLSAAARELARHPAANAVARGRARPRVRRQPAVDVKLTLDRMLGGQRVVLSAVLPGADRASLARLQEQVDHYTAGDPDRMPEFAGVRLLHRLPWLVGRWAFAREVRSLDRRSRRFGTLAVTSLGHRPVDGFHSQGGTTVTLGVGRVVDRAVVRAGQVAVAPVMRLNLAFDHRVIDGAQAADLLADIRDALQRGPDRPAGSATADGQASRPVPPGLAAAQLTAAPHAAAPPAASAPAAPSDMDAHDRA
ncbi:Acyltransferase [Frankia canadensis]|uniref:Acyltransferase n=1 Tax=Frankia canadensis TaxID=1836972 RepID=A0A2I2KVA3_9ACTN|nr:2-oxo acid dehydrogenase subunit E2 [Frankia canadensis]SNQ49580.1 Acyltransferase [Frankia canadensis]SOU56870.1 Acyltransferase [Frankia canadensis]